MNSPFRSGFISIIGRPNAGKSTLLNALVGQKVAIVADKPQTTRTSIQGVLTTPEAQIVFLDTPGIHKGDSPLNKRLMDAVRASLEERDLLLFVADVSRGFGEQERKAVDVARKTSAPVFLVLNKIDLLEDKALLLPLIEQYKASFDFADYLPVCASRKTGLDELMAAIVARLPEGPAYFPEDHVTDQPERFLAGELVREKVLLATRQEVPHSVAVTVDKWEETPTMTTIYATIHVERDGQKGIVIGKQGAMLKRIGTLAREEMERLFGIKIFLDLHVRVQPNWRERADFLAGELVREKVLLATRQEVPHSVAVTVDKWEETPTMTTIYATIHVERDGQKGIVIGKQGAMLKRIGTLAREEMERLFGIKIFLDLHVRVQPNWRERADFLNALDWRTMAGNDEK